MISGSWSVEFEFNVDHSAHVSGDGFAFWVAKERARDGPVFGGADRFEGLGIFFDAYSNSGLRVICLLILALVSICYGNDRGWKNSF